MSNTYCYVNHDKKTVIIWSPKAACTTLVNYFIRDICCISTKIDPRVIAGAYACHDYAIPLDYHIYWCTRDPFARIVSCYINKFVNHGGKRLSATTLEPFAIGFLEQIKVKYTDLTFTKFLLGIKQLLAKGEQVDSHFNTQVNLSNYNKIRNHPHLKIFDIKDLSSVFNHSFSRQNASNYANLASYDVTNIKTTELTDDMLHLDNFSAARQLIREIYRADYDLLHY